jgi:cytoskeletal protein CcmA (bactofilin family)
MGSNININGMSINIDDDGTIIVNGKSTKQKNIEIIKDTTIKGDVNGNIYCNGNLTLIVEGDIVGNVECNNIEIKGDIVGNVTRK